MYSIFHGLDTSTFDKTRTSIFTKNKKNGVSPKVCVADELVCVADESRRWLEVCVADELVCVADA
jgi:hypothetical protein